MAISKNVGSTQEVERQLAKEDKQSIENKSITPIQLVEQNVKEYIIGQDVAIRRILTAIYRSLYFKSVKSNILVIGSSGVGKTETLKQIAKRLNIPYTEEDATKYTQEGYYGKSVEDMLFHLIVASQYNLQKAQKGMIIIDEIDKKTGDEKGVSGAKVLKSLLKIIEGTKYKLDDCIFDTSQLIIVFCGAFEGMEKIRDKRLGQGQIGFRQQENNETLQNKFTKQDLVQYGMPEEFVGRIDTIVEMNKLQKEDLVQILKKSRLSIFKRYQRELRNMGVSLRYNSKLLELIADRSLQLDTGARELSNTVNYIFEDIIYNVMANSGSYSECRLFVEIVDDNTRYKLS